jgi:hypothetical protein
MERERDDEEGWRILLSLTFEFQPSDGSVPCCRSE